MPVLQLHRSYADQQTIQPGFRSRPGGVKTSQAHTTTCITTVIALTLFLAIAVASLTSTSRCRTTNFCCCLGSISCCALYTFRSTMNCAIFDAHWFSFDEVTTAFIGKQFLSCFMLARCRASTFVGRPYELASTEGELNSRLRVMYNQSNIVPRHSVLNIPHHCQQQGCVRTDQWNLFRWINEYLAPRSRPHLLQVLVHHLSCPCKQRRYMCRRM